MLESESKEFAYNFMGDTTLIQPYHYNKIRMVGLPTDFLVPKYNLEIIIDTAYDFHAKGFVYQQIKDFKISDETTDLSKNGMDRYPDAKRYYDESDSLRNAIVMARPVLIYNPNTQLALVGGYAMIQEALDSDNKWKPIEFRKHYESCIVQDSSFYYQLDPKHYIGAYVMKYHGNFKTKIRIKCNINGHIYYSKPVAGNINRSQFDQSFLKTYFRLNIFYSDDEFETLRRDAFLDVEPPKPTINKTNANVSN